MEENKSRTCALKLTYMYISNRDRRMNFLMNSNTIDVARACDDRVRLSEYPNDVLATPHNNITMQTDSLNLRGVKKKTTKMWGEAAGRKRGRKQQQR